MSEPQAQQGKEIPEVIVQALEAALEVAVVVPVRWEVMALVRLVVLEVLDHPVLLREVL